MIRQFIILALLNLSTRKLRTFLTIIGIMIGVGTVVALLALSQGLQYSIQQEFEVIGVDKLILSQKAPAGSVLFDPSFTEDEVEFIESIKGVRMVASYSTLTVPVEFDDELRFLMVAGIPTDEHYALIKETNAYGIELGRELQKRELDSVVLGFNHREGSVFGKRVGLRDHIVIEGQKLKVVGFYERIGSPPDDNIVIMPEQTFAELFNTAGKVSTILAKTDPGEDPLAVSERIRRDLAKKRGFELGKEDFVIQTPQDVLETLNEILFVVQTVLLGISMIALAVGCMGIANTMFTSTFERRKEIGILKAIGANSLSILSLFLFEAGIIGMIGGVFGLFLGAAISSFAGFIINAVFGFRFLSGYIPYSMVFTIVFITFVIGTLAGAIPAYTASKLLPVDALKQE